MGTYTTKETDDVAGASRPATFGDESPEGGSAEPKRELDSDFAGDAPAPVAEFAAACVRFVATRYGLMLDFTPETLSVLDQWLRDARADTKAHDESLELVQAAAGAYLGEVIRRHFGAHWVSSGELSDWRLCLSTVCCAFNPIGMAREALLVGPAEGWHGHLELDPGEDDAVRARMCALPAVSEDEYYAPSTRFDVLSIVVDALRTSLRSRGLEAVRFSVQDYVDSPSSRGPRLS